MKAKNPSGGSRGLTVPKSTVVGRKNIRSSSVGEISVEDTAVFPPLRMDLKVTFSHSTQGDRNGKVGQVIGFSEEVISGELIRSSGAVQEAPKRSSSSADSHNHVLPKSSYSDLAQVDPADGDNGGRNGRTITDAVYKVSMTDPAVLMNFEVPRSEHYAHEQWCSQASEYMTDRSLGFVETRSIEVGIGVQNLPMSKCGVSKLDKNGTELRRVDDNGNGKQSLSATLRNATNEPTSFPATIKITTHNPYVLMGPSVEVKSPLSAAPETFTKEPTTFPAVVQATTSEPKRSMLTGPDSGVQSDTFSGLIRSPKRGSGIHESASDCAMGDRVGGYSAGNKDRAPTYSGHDSLGISVSHNDQSDMGILRGTVSNQSQRGILVGGGQPSHYEQIRRSSWIRKGDHEPIKCWNNLFSAPIRTNPKLDFYAPACVDGVLEIHPPDEAVFEGGKHVEGMLGWPIF